MKIMNLYWTHNDDEYHNMFTKHKYTWLLRCTLLNEKTEDSHFWLPAQREVCFLVRNKTLYIIFNIVRNMAYSLQKIPQSILDLN